MSKVQNKFFVLTLFFYFVLWGAKGIFAATDFTLQEKYPYVLLFPQISLNNSFKEEIDNGLRHGVDYHIVLQWTLKKKNPYFFLPDIFVLQKRSNFIVSFSRINQSYSVRQKKIIVPFRNFSDAFSYVLSFPSNISMREKEPAHYKVQLYANGYAIKFFFPLNIIYENFMDTLGFSQNSAWRSFVWEKN